VRVDGVRGTWQILDLACPIGVSRLERWERAYMSDVGEILASKELFNLRKELDPYLSSIPNTGDKLLFIDLCRLVLNKENFSHETIELLENISLSQYFLLLSYVCTSRHSTGDYAEPRLPGFCQTCRELTYREVRYRSDFQFVGRLLVCQNCGETILEPVGSGTACQDC